MNDQLTSSSSPSHNILLHIIDEPIPPNYSSLSSTSQSPCSSSSSSPSLNGAKPPLTATCSVGKVSICSDSETSFYDERVTDGRWIDNQPACDHFTSLLTSVYCLLVTIFALALELLQKLTVDEWFAEMSFYAFMYGGGLLFFVYCYAFMLYPGWFVLLEKILKKYKLVSKEKKWPIDKASHTGEGAGSLYLRLGALFFGTVSIVFYGLEIFICTTNYYCHSTQLAKYVISGLFTFVIIVGSKNFAKLGTMHLVAVNLWTWFRFVLAKQAARANNVAKEQKEQHQQRMASVINSDTIMAFHDTLSTTDGAAETLLNSMDDSLLDNITELITSSSTVIMPSGQFNSGSNSFVGMTTTMQPSVPGYLSMEFFGDTATFLTTCIVEYSLIGAAVMFILWKTIGQRASNKSNGQRAGRKHRMRIDCSSSSTGLFAGLLFLIAAFVSIGVYTFFSQLRGNKNALLVFGLSDLALFVVSLIGCSIGLYRMRSLQYSNRGYGNAEVLDEILLVIGVTGELVYCSTGLILWISTQCDRENSPLYIFVYLTRLFQVVVQTVFILMSGRLRAYNSALNDRKPGKQFVTFLLVANVTLFFFHTFEGLKSEFGYSEHLVSTACANLIHDVDSVSTAYAMLIHGVAPLIVFYRFHSSVCLAEIWKHSYTVKSSSVNKQMSIDNYLMQQ